MIQCTVCHTENDEFAIACVQCRGFLQNRIPNLNFFETIWSILESPRKAFHDVTLAEHKNYSLFLFSLLGISLSFTGLWYFKAGERFESLLTLIVWGLVSGGVLGLVAGPLVSFIHHLVSRILQGKSKYRNSLGIVAYSVTPVAVSLVFILPIELLTFGMYLFTSNPSPYAIKPVSFIALAGIDTFVAVWAIGLAIVGTVIAYRLSALRATVAVMVTACGLLLPLLELGERLMRVN